jgi:hypothetical protein
VESLWGPASQDTIRPLSRKQSRRIDTAEVGVHDRRHPATLYTLKLTFMSSDSSGRLTSRPSSRITKTTSQEDLYLPAGPLFFYFDPYSRLVFIKPSAAQVHPAGRPEVEDGDVGRFPVELRSVSSN